MSNYPNLELLEYKVRQALAEDNDFIRLIATRKHFYPDFTVEVFSQTWGNTCTGFDILANGEPAIGGSAMTREYTTVFHELDTDCYIVCFGDRLCYKVTNANEQFLEDLKNRQMASLSKAKQNY